MLHERFFAEQFIYYNGTREQFIFPICLAAMLPWIGWLPPGRSWFYDLRPWAAQGLKEGLYPRTQKRAPATDGRRKEKNMVLTKKRKLVLVAVVCMLALMLQGVVGASLRVDYPSSDTVKTSIDEAASTTWRIACTSSANTELYGYLRYLKDSTWLMADDAYCEGGRAYNRSAVADGVARNWKLGLEAAWNSPTGYAIAYAISEGSDG